MVFNVVLCQAEAERAKERDRIEKAMAATLAANKDGNNDDDDEEDDDDNSTQKAASTKASPKVTRKVVAMKPLPKVVEGSLKMTLVSFELHFSCLDC